MADTPGYEALKYMAQRREDPGINTTVLDVGSGQGLQAAVMRDMGYFVTTLDSNDRYKPDIVAEVGVTALMLPQYDIVWSSHVLEHLTDPIAALTDMRSLAKEAVIVTVPPMKTEIVGGHINLYTPELLVYHMMLAGFNMVNAFIWQYGYNITAIARPQEVISLVVRQGLAHDKGDLTTLAPYLPTFWLADQDTIRPDQPQRKPGA